MEFTRDRLKKWLHPPERIENFRKFKLIEYVKENYDGIKTWVRVTNSHLRETGVWAKLYQRVFVEGLIFDFVRSDERFRQHLEDVEFPSLGDAERVSEEARKVTAVVFGALKEVEMEDL